MSSSRPRPTPTTADAAPERPAGQAADAPPARPRHRRPELVGLPIGPESLTWRLNGDSRSLLLIGRTGVLQNMHPAVSQALKDHSTYFADPIGRISRSIPQILGVIYDDEREQTGTTVRDWHQPIRAKAGAGYQYRALDPAVFYWTHATFIDAVIETQRLLGTPLSRAELERYYLESITWWRRYGMTDAPLPENYAEFRRYWDDMFTSELAATPVALEALAATEMPVPPHGIPESLWRLAGERLAVGGATWLTKATLPPQAREILGVHWTRQDERKARAFARSVKLAWPAVPPRARRLPRAAAADRRLAIAA